MTKPTVDTALILDGGLLAGEVTGDGGLTLLIRHGACPLKMTLSREETGRLFVLAAEALAANNKAAKDSQPQPEEGGGA